MRRRVKGVASDDMAESRGRRDPTNRTRDQAVFSSTVLSPPVSFHITPESTEDAGSTSGSVGVTETPEESVPLTGGVYPDGNR